MLAFAQIWEVHVMRATAGCRWVPGALLLPCSSAASIGGGAGQ